MDAEAAGLNPLLALGAVVLIVVLGRYALRPVLRIVAETRIPDVFTAAALLLVIATALLVNFAGLSMALGAFIAGVLLADSEYRHELEADLEPFKGLLLGLFFIAVGMSVNLGLVGEAPLRVLAITLGLMAAKGLVLYALGRLSSGPLRGPGQVAGARHARRRRVCLRALSHRGVGGPARPPTWRSCWCWPSRSPCCCPRCCSSRTTGGSAAGSRRRRRRPTTASRPRTTGSSSPASAALARSWPASSGPGAFPSPRWRSARPRWTSSAASATGSYYGDAARPEMLRAAQLDKAEVLVIAVDDQEASVKIAEFARHHFPDVKVFARVRNRQHAFRMMELGVPYIIRETYVSSLEMAEQVLEWLGDEPAAARRSVALFRAHDEATLQDQFAIRDDDDKFLATSPGVRGAAGEPLRGGPAGRPAPVGAPSGATGNVVAPEGAPTGETRSGRLPAALRTFPGE